MKRNPKSRHLFTLQFSCFTSAGSKNEIKNILHQSIFTAQRILLKYFLANLVFLKSSIKEFFGILNFNKRVENYKLALCGAAIYWEYLEI